MGVKLLYYILIILLSSFGGFMISKELFERRRKYVGNIVVIKDPDAPIHGKRIYSLELDDNPEIIETKKEVTFRVVISSEESDRE
jgi:hypothetical protein